MQSNIKDKCELMEGLIDKIKELNDLFKSALQEAATSYSILGVTDRSDLLGGHCKRNLLPESQLRNLTR